jgi:hypothetical protein
LGSKKISLEPPKEPETRLEGEFDPKLQKAKDEESKVSSVVNNTETPSETSNYSSHEMNSQTKEKKSKHHKDKKHKHKHKKVRVYLFICLLNSDAQRKMTLLYRTKKKRNEKLKKSTVQMTNRRSHQRRNLIVM